MPRTITAIGGPVTRTDILDKLPGLVALYNIHSGRYIYVNNGIMRLLGYSAEELVENGIEFITSLIHPRDRERIAKENEAAIRHANTVNALRSDGEPIVSFEYRLRHAKGHWVWLHTEGSVYDRNNVGDVNTVLNISIDITKRKTAEEKLLLHSTELEHRIEQNAERLELALEATDTGIWEWNIEAGTLIWSPEMMRLYGMDPDKDVITYEKFMAALHPDDREKKQQILMHAAETGEPYQVDHRCIWKDGTLHWIQGRGKAYMREGKAYRMVGTAINIDEHKAAEKLKTKTELLKAEREELVALNKAKDEFISLASHQLRTPATGVKQYIGMLLTNFAGKPAPKQRMLLERAYESNERQIRIINDLLLVAKVDAGKVNIQKQPFNISELIRDVVNEHLDIIKQRKQKVEIDVPQKLTAIADSFYLRTVLENLLNNASKYSGDETTISVSASSDNLGVRISVDDQGIGISNADYPKLFRKFTRLNNERTKAVDGNGLGLYWSKKIIDLHKGKLTVSSRLNHGSSFVITLPPS